MKPGAGVRYGAPLWLAGASLSRSAPISAIYMLAAFSAANTRSLRNGGRRNRTPVAS
jgi:hypothetical protein